MSAPHNWKIGFVSSSFSLRACHACRACGRGEAAWAHDDRCPCRCAPPGCEYPCVSVELFSLFLLLLAWFRKAFNGFWFCYALSTSFVHCCTSFAAPCKSPCKYEHTDVNETTTHENSNGNTQKRVKSVIMRMRWASCGWRAGWLAGCLAGWLAG